MNKVTSTAGVKAPFLRLVNEAPAQPDTQASNTPNVVATSIKKYISQTGKFPSYALRVVVWPDEDGSWAFGVLKEGWKEGSFLQGEPEEFRLWKCRTFFNHAHAMECLKTFDINKTIENIGVDLLGYSNAMGKKIVGEPELVAYRKVEAAGIEHVPMPFARNAIIERKKLGAENPARLSS